MSCTVREREQAREARRALLAHEAVFGASLVSPSEGTRPAWTVGLALVEADGLGPALLRTAAEHGLTVVEVAERSPSETRVVLTV